MAKQRKKVKRTLITNRALPLFDINSGDDFIFDVKFHPEKRHFAVGFGSGRVHYLSYDAEAAESYQQQLLSARKDETSVTHAVFRSVTDISTPTDGILRRGWDTKRHKGSCRGLAFSADGSRLFSVGSDNVIKKTDSETGKVVNKTTINTSDPADTSHVTKLAVSLVDSPLVFTGSEKSVVRIFDSRTMKQSHAYNLLTEDPTAHGGECVNWLLPLGPKTPHVLLAAYGSKLARVDVRKGVLARSDDQEDELLSLAIPDGDRPSLAVAGMAGGLLTVWDREKNRWADQVNRVRLSEESIDCVIPTLDYAGESSVNAGNCVWAAGGDGRVRRVNVKFGKVLELREHSGTDEVGFLDLDAEYRLMSAGMDRIRLWGRGKSEEEVAEAEAEAEAEADDSESGSEDDDEEEDEKETSGLVSASESNESSDESSEAESDSGEDPETSDSDGEDRVVKGSKKRAAGGSKADSAAAMAKKIQKNTVKTKEQRNMHKRVHGIKRFDL